MSTKTQDRVQKWLEDNNLDNNGLRTDKNHRIDLYLSDVLSMFHKHLIDNGGENGDENTAQRIDAAYILGVFNTGGVDVLSDELKRLKDLNIKPHEFIGLL